jgi:hypothetical protein
MRIGPLPPTPGQNHSAITASPGSSWSQSSPGSSNAGEPPVSPPPIAPPRVESLVFSGLITGSGVSSDPAPPLPARNTDPAPAPPPRNLAGLPPVGSGGLPPAPPAKLPRPVSHESLNSVSVGGGGSHGQQRRSSHAAAPYPPVPYRASDGTPQQAMSPPDPPAGRHHSHTRTRSSPVSLEQTLGEYTCQPILK